MLNNCIFLESICKTYRHMFFFLPCSRPILPTFYDHLLNGRLISEWFFIYCGLKFHTFDICRVSGPLSRLLNSNGITKTVWLLTASFYGRETKKGRTYEFLFWFIDIIVSKFIDCFYAHPKSRNSNSDADYWTFHFVTNKVKLIK